MTLISYVLSANWKSVFREKCISSEKTQQIKFRSVITFLVLNGMFHRRYFPRGFKNKCDSAKQHNDLCYNRTEVGFLLGESKLE